MAGQEYANFGLCRAALCIQYRRAGALHHVICSFSLVGGETLTSLRIYGSERRDPCHLRSWSGWMRTGGLVRHGEQCWSIIVHWQGQVHLAKLLVFENVVERSPGRLYGHTYHFGQWIAVEMFMVTLPVTQQQIPVFPWVIYATASELRSWLIIH